MSRDSAILFSSDAKSAAIDWSEPPESLPPLSDEVHLWRVTPSACNASQLDELSQSLSADEHERAMRFRFDVHQSRYVACRGGLRTILARYLGKSPRELLFEYGKHGKPHLADSSGLHFNMSHSQDLALIAVRRVSPLGIDVEGIDGSLDHRAVATENFSAEESRAVCAAPSEFRAETFFQIWTRREAVAKAFGVGLTGLPCRSTLEDVGICSVRHFIPDRGVIGALAILDNSSAGKQI